ncbi:MAG TPA: ATP-binding protein [Opitutaceae bacterium]|nr:ATP-binding protein [Opitutaceae bacterium]
MNLNSFRLKIALLSGGITGLLLVGSGLALWRVSYQFNLDRLDREIRNLAQANLDRVLGGDHWIRLEEALKFVAGDRSSARFVLWVKNYDRVIFQSPEWPKEIAPDSFPVSERYEVPGGALEREKLPAPPRRGEEISPRNPALPRRSAQFFTRVAGGRSWRVGVMGNPYVTLVVAVDIDEFNARMVELRNLFLLALPAALLLAAGGAWLVARRALRPVTALTETAERVTARGLDQRIPAMTRDREFNRLITVCNAMLDRLQKSFQQATRFSADAAHELKTPLSRLQLELEQALESAPADSAQQGVYGSLLEETHRLKAIVEKLLLLSLADAGRLPLQKQAVDLSALLANIVEDCRAQSAGLAIDAEISAGLRVEADPDLLEQALQNLALNALKYNRPDGWVRIVARGEGGEVLVFVENSGPPIPAPDRERIFERFFRADPSRSGRSGGAGLGLSLAREIVRAHGGEVILVASDGELNRFVARLPRAVESAASAAEKCE